MSTILKARNIQKKKKEKKCEVSFIETSQHMTSPPSPKHNNTTLTPTNPRAII